MIKTVITRSISVIGIFALFTVSAQSSTVFEQRSDYTILGTTLTQSFNNDSTECMTLTKDFNYLMM